MSADRTIYKFGNFELNPSESSLLQSGTAVPITPKALRLLCLLTENQGHVLDKSYLLDQIWTDSYVEEGNLTFNIRQLRKILGDEVKNPKYIETVPKRGYRFIGSLEKLGPANGGLSNPMAPASATVQRQPEKRPLWKPWIFAIPLIFAAGGVAAVESWFGIFGGDSTSAKLLSTPYSTERLSTDGNVRFAALSKSGEFMVYVTGNPNEKQGLRIRELATGQSREFLGATEDKYLGLELAHDDSAVFFVRQAPTEPVEACLFKMKLVGGIPESLGCGMEGWFDISNNGKAISYVRCTYQPDDFCSLYVSDENFANERLLVTRNGRTRITDNAISPDGRSVVFASGQSVDGSEDFGIYKFDLESAAETAVVDEKFFNVVAIDWMPDENSLLATAVRSNNATIYFWTIDPETRTATPLKQGNESFKAISIDQHGSKLVSTIRSADFRVSVHSMDQETKPVTLGNGWTSRFSSDGRIMFASDRSGTSTIWSADLDGANVKHLSTGYDDFPVSSSDGSSIYYSSRRSGRIEVWTMQSDGSGAKQLSSVEGGFPIAVSPDGFWIYYLSAMKRSLRRISKDGSIEEEISEKAMRGAEVSADARFVAFIEEQATGTMIALFPLQSGEKRVSIALPGSGMKAKHLSWSKNGEHIYALLFDPLARTNSVWRLGIDGSTAVKVRDLNVPELGERSSFSVSPDERYFAVTTGYWKHDAVLVHGLK